MQTYTHDFLTRALVCNNARQAIQDAAKCPEMASAKLSDPLYMHYRAIVEFEHGHLEAARKWVTNALAACPDSAELHCTQAKLLDIMQKCNEAILVYKQSIALKPDYATAFYGLGTALSECSNEDSALDAYKNALALEPDYPEVLNDIGVLLKDKGSLAEAAQSFIRAINAQPRFPLPLNNLGLLYFTLGRLDEAESLYRRALDCKPEFPAALNNLGNVLYSKGSFEESIPFFRKALVLRPTYSNALNNLGNALRNIGRLSEAIAAFEQAITLGGNNPDFHFNLSMALLAAGRFDQGWRAFESRWETPQFANLRFNTHKPLWKGETTEGRTLLIRAEQGFGDTLQFCRYAPLTAERGLHVILEVQPALVKLLTTLTGVGQVVAQGDDLPDFDSYCPMMSLPLAFKTRFDTVPASVPYLSVHAKDKAAWRKRLTDKNKGTLRVGLAWAGQSRLHSPDLAAVDRRRSLAVDLLAPIIDSEGIQFYSLQKDGAPAPKEFGLINFMDKCKDFYETAAFVCNLDLVISVDTAVAHCAGALGKPVWVLNRFDACWRWMEHRDTSPWYPTLRLFRQPSPGDWHSVVLRVKQELTTARGAISREDIPF